MTTITYYSFLKRIAFLSEVEGIAIELTSRQLEIIDIVNKRAPITGEQIAERLNLTRPNHKKQAISPAHPWLVK